jgi:hypothetical protein
VQWLRTRGLLQENVAEIARDVAALKGQTEDLDTRVAMLEKSSAETGSASAQLADLNTRLAAIEADALRNPDRDALAQLQARIARLESASPGEMFKAATAMLARANLARAAEEAAPLTSELNALRAVAPDDPVLTIAETGAPTRAMLVARFPDAARAALDAMRAGAADDNFFARLWASLRGLVRVRRLGDRAGTTTEDSLARAQADCDRGDLAGAVLETRSISGTAAAPLQSWLTDADARLALDRAIADMNLRIVPGEGAPAGAASR